jgi:squalene-hopene/tetraprenyl-beta-curcumene cyclase
MKIVALVTCISLGCAATMLLAGDTRWPITGSGPLRAKQDAARLADRDTRSATEGLVPWSPKAAATYLDSRFVWWMNWPTAARDHETFCVSCHTVLPYAMARPSLRADLAEQTRSQNESTLVENVRKRVRLWEQAEPYYPGGQNAVQSRGTESVLNALILASYDAPSGVLSADTRLAFEHMWAQQLKEGVEGGSWPWQRFDLGPWEADAESQYYGATLAAIAVGRAPANYRSSAEIQDGMKLLREYLLHDYTSRILLDRLMLVWASAKLPELLTGEQKAAIIEAALREQQADGGFSLSFFLGGWQRRDRTPLETKSDGYATGLVALVLQEAGLVRYQLQLQRALDWLAENQGKEGRWLAYSANKQRNLNSDVGRFMSDAATAYAVLALKRAGEGASLK